MSLDEVMADIERSRPQKIKKDRASEPRKTRVEFDPTPQELRQARRYASLTKPFETPEYDLDDWSPPPAEGIGGIMEELERERGACTTCHTFNSLDREQDTIFHVRRRQKRDGEWKVVLVMVYYGRAYCRFCGAGL